MSARRLLIAVLLSTSAAAGAVPRLDPTFSDHAVLQRGQRIQLTGTGAAGEALKIRFSGQDRSVRIDRTGHWLVAYPPMASGSGLSIEVRAPSGSASASDIAIGDVWLCSGQSNMEFPVSRALNGDGEANAAHDPDLRLLMIPKQAVTSPATRFSGPVAWQVAKPSSVAPFSAACYFMARKLRTDRHVPVGLIDASWGGTAIRSWIDLATNSVGGGEEMALLRLYQSDPVAANARFAPAWQDWWHGRAATSPWASADGLTWKPMKVGYWEGWGDPAFAAFDGLVWAQTSVDLTPAEAAQAATLSLGVIDEIDETWVNGVAVGNTFGWDVKRHYEIPAGRLHAGHNRIVVGLIDTAGAGGFAGPASELSLTLADGTVKPLAPRLEYSVALSPPPGDFPRPPWDAASGPSLIHNGMIAPLGRFPVAGMAWYQGEADAGSPARYDAKLASLIAGWRRQFGAPSTPFLIVGLANFGAPSSKPSPSGWAEIRDAQRRVAASDPAAALIPAVDLGDRLDIHPANKQEVGRRLALAAEALADGEQKPGPTPLAALRTAKGIILSFANVRGALHSWNGRPLGFELCAADQANCRYADARAEGLTIVLTDDSRPATRVRFAWADAPVTNLYDEAPLPVPGFELPIR
jgi:sialate O-acetylesterase